MTISLCRKDHGKDSKRLLSCLMVAVYLLVVHFTLSHVHTAPDITLQSEISWQHPVISLVDDTPDNQNTEHRHSSACMLVSQASSPVHLSKTTVLFDPVHNEQPYLLSIHSPTPTKRQTRAPPGYKI